MTVTRVAEPVPLEQDLPDIVLSVDTHRDIHVAAVVTAADALVEGRSFPTPADGYEQLLAWARTTGHVSGPGLSARAHTAPRSAGIWLRHDGANHNTIIDSGYFGMAFQDGTFTAVKDTIRGGVGGLAVVASAARLDRVKITRIWGDPTRTFECCGFTATGDHEALTCGWERTPILGGQSAADCGLPPRQTPRSLRMRARSRRRAAGLGR
ncbi:hypothetical protein [Streptomyces sp. NPDC127112]|uniref:hypothetical protein n=1 Tax=Streptomyces sp. NPDC127112 TaxID=3345364 RepID=UPI00363BFDE1